MNIIFLDIDSVLNHGLAGKTDEDKYGFAQDCIDSLRYIVNSVPNTKIVISSSWKLIEDLPYDPEHRLWREEFKKRLGYDLIIGDTPNTYEYPKIESCDLEPIPGKGRGDDINLWIERNAKKIDLENFVILDDNISSGNISKLFPNNFVNCDEFEPFEGLSMRHAKTAVWILTNFGRNRQMTENTFITSDTHFFHRNIIRYCERPWNSGKDENGEFLVTDEDVVRMNEDLISNWNSVVGKNDIVWHLGDFSFGKKDNVPELVKRLNGKINLVMGNHDRHKIDFYYNSGFHRVYDRPIIINNFFILSHEPLEWTRNPMYNIYGHVHDNDRYKTWSKTGCCVCVERHDYKPISWKKINEKIEEYNNDN